AYASGAWSIRGIVHKLIEDGVAPAGRGQWQPSTIKHILGSEVYLGHTCWNVRHQGKYARLAGGKVKADDTARGREQERRRGGHKRLPPVSNGDADGLGVPDPPPPLTDPATFEACRRRRQANRARTTPVAGGGPWLLTGLIRCGACGGRMHGVSPSG